MFDRCTKPKELPPEEDVKKSERRVKSINGKFIENPEKLKNKKN